MSEPASTPRIETLEARLAERTAERDEWRDRAIRYTADNMALNNEILRLRQELHRGPAQRMPGGAWATPEDEADADPESA